MKEQERREKNREEKGRRNEGRNRREEKRRRQKKERGCDGKVLGKERKINKIENEETRGKKKCDNETRMLSGGKKKR